VSVCNIAYYSHEEVSRLYLTGGIADIGDLQILLYVVAVNDFDSLE
jgi:hypothetical protein